MSDQAASAFIRQELVPERAAPIKTTGFAGFVRTRLLNSPGNILLTIASALLLWFTVVPAVNFLLIDAVWQGKDRNACLAENAGHVVGACWPFVQAKFTQFVYGFYPELERWRVNVTFLLAALLLLPLLIPRLPAKGLNAGLLFIAFPIVAFFLLHGGGLHGFGVSWTAEFLSGFTTSIGDAGAKLIGAGDASTVALVGVLLALLGKTIVLLSSGISLLLWPLVWLRDQIQASSRPVWIDIAATAAIVSILLFVLNGGFRTGWRALIVSLATFAGIGLVIALMHLDRGGLQAIPRGQGEAASALGLSYWKTTGLIVMPQALRHVIPGLVNSFIGLFKDTSLVSIVALFDLLGSLRASFADPVWSTPTTVFTGFAFAGIVYFTFCFGMSRYSLFVEHRLNVHRRS